MKQLQQPAVAVGIGEVGVGAVVAPPGVDARWRRDMENRLRKRLELIKDRARRLGISFKEATNRAIRAGLDRDLALAAVTRQPARAVGLDKRYGSVEPGRVANLVVWSGDPFELSTRAEAVIIRGRKVSLRTRQTALFERYR